MDKLAPNLKTKLQNILQHYTEYRKAYYDDNVGIANENKRREEVRMEIHRELQKFKNARETEKYVLLNNEKYKIYEQIEAYEHIIYNDNDEDAVELKKINETLGILYDSIESIKHKQLEIIKTEGVNTKFLEDNNIDVMARLVD
jgi:hypothetical protein